jgi:hypothetical protein
MYKEISARRLRTISDGRRTFIPGKEIVARSCLREEQGPIPHRRN